MNENLRLRILAEIMDWSDDQAREEYGWLRLMARLKYDGYRDFQAGMRFIESLATWLQQFARAERQTAYDFVRNQLVYLGPAEIHHLVEQFFPHVVRPYLLRTIATNLGIRYHEVLSHSSAGSTVATAIRRTLVMGLSDGARIDQVRHANAGVLSNEQIVHSTQIDPDKWSDLLAELRTDLNDPGAKFLAVHLVDDFAGTGSSFLRSDEGTHRWTGKLIRFRDSLDHAVSELGGDSPFVTDWHVCAHYYVASARATATIEKRLQDLRHTDSRAWPRAMSVSFGLVLPEDLPIDSGGGRNADFVSLTRKYYDPNIRTRHTDVGGAVHLGLGYGGSALPVVLEHNTPNNSVALLWAETSGDTCGAAPTPAMRPLFRRRQRHA